MDGCLRLSDLIGPERKRGLSDFSIATIVRLGHKQGEPKAQSLRNKTDESYRALLRSFEDENLGKNTLLGKSVPTDEQCLCARTCSTRSTDVPTMRDANDLLKQQDELLRFLRDRGQSRESRLQ